MASTKTLTANGSKGHHKFTLTVKETATSTENNTSTISIIFKLSPVSTGWDWEDHSSVKGTVTVAGTEYSWACPTYNGSSTVTLVSKTKTITHSSDGSKSISLAFSCQSDTSVSYLPGTASASGTLTLTTIPRESTLAVSGTKTLGSNVTLTVTRHSTSFTHTITAKCGSADAVTVGNAKTTASPTFTLPLEWASQNTTGTTVSITFSITTYNGNAKVGSAKTVTISASMPSSVKPIVSSVAVAAGDTASTSHFQKYGGYVQGKSTVKLTATASQSYSSALKTYAFVCSGKTYTATVNNVVTGVLSSTGSITASAKVTDARSRTSDEKNSTAFTVWPYSPPSISATVHRCNSTGEESMTGAYGRIDWAGSISSLNNKNTGSVTIQYKKTTDETYTEVSGQPISSEDLANPFVFSAADDSAYDVIVLIQDDFATGLTEKKLSTASVPLHFKKNGRGFAIGKIADALRDGLDIGWDLWVKDVDMTLSDTEYDEVKPSGSTGDKRLFKILKGLVDKIANKVDKVSGKDLSTNDYTTAEKDKLAGIGTILGAVNGSTSIANKSVAGDDSTVNLGSFTVPPGVWIVKVLLRWNNNSTGNRMVWISDSASGDAYSVWNQMKVPASPTGYTYVELVTFLQPTESKTFYVNAGQNSGKALTVATRWGAIRVA